jgi:hypothetical protein
MRLISHTDKLNNEGKDIKRIKIKLAGKKKIKELALIIFDYYFERTSYGVIRANGFTHTAPTAVFHFDSRDNTVNDYQTTANTNIDTQTTSVTFLWIYNRFFGHF